LIKKSSGKKQQIKALPERMPRAGHLLYQLSFPPEHNRARSFSMGYAREVVVAILRN